MSPREQIRCWHCGGRHVYWRTILSPWHRRVGRGAFVCDDCGAAGDREDFLADDDTSTWELMMHEYEGE